MIDENDKREVTELMEGRGYCVTEDFLPGLLARMAKRECRKGWILTGGTGSGKTTVAKFAKYLWNRGRMRDEAIVMKTARDISIDMLSAMQDGEYGRRMLEAYCAVHPEDPLKDHGLDLIVDDFGAESKTVTAYGMTIHPMDDLVMERYKMFPLHLTFFTTNLSEEEIRAEYGERVYSRLCEMCDFLELDEIDYRKMEAEA